jgi:hypothetical protein
MDVFIYASAVKINKRKWSFSLYNSVNISPKMKESFNWACALSKAMSHYTILGYSTRIDT